MKILKAAMTVDSIKPTRERILEGEAEGKLADGLSLVAELPIAKAKGLFTDTGSFQRKVLAHYDANGALLDEDGGECRLLTEGRACAATVLYGLVDSQEFEDASVDKIKYRLEQGRVITVKLRLKLRPEGKQIAKVRGWLKNEITLTLNGETISVAEAAEDEQETGQSRIDLGGGESGHGEEIDDADDNSLQAGLDMLDADNRASVEKLAGDGILAVKGRGPSPKLLDDHGRPIDESGDADDDALLDPPPRTKPSTAHGEVIVPG